MKSMSIRQAVVAIHQGSLELGMDVSPGDVAWIISSFFEVLVNSPGGNDKMNTWLQSIADEVSRVKDET